MAVEGGSGGGVGSGAIRAGEAFIEMKADDSKFSKTLNQAIEKIKSFGGAIRNVGIGVTAAGSTLLAPFVGAITSAVLYGDKIQEIADKLGTTAEGVSRLGYAADMSASSLEEAAGASAMLSKSINAAANGSVDQVEAFQKMGISAKDFLALPLDQRFLRIAETLDGMGSELDKNRLKYDLFGKQALAVNPLLSQGADELRALFERSDKVGDTISNEDAENAAILKDTFDELLKVLKSIPIEIGKTFFGFTGQTQEAREVIVQIGASIRQFIRDNAQTIAIVAAVAAGIVAVGVALTAFGLIVTGVGMGVAGLIGILAALKAIIWGVWAAVTSGPGLVIAAIAGITYAILQFTDVGKETFGEIGEIFGSTFANIKDIFNETIGGIASALKSGNLKLAADIAWAGLKAGFSEVVLALQQMWNRFKDFFVDMWHDAILQVRKWISSFNTIAAVSITDALEWLSKTANSSTVDASIAWVLGVDTKDFEGIRTTLRKMGAEEIKGFEKDRDRKQTASDEARAKDLLAASNNVAQSRAELAALVAQARELEAAGGDPQRKVERQQQAIVKGLSEAVRGAFASQNFSNVFAFGPVSSEMKKQTAELEELNETTTVIKNRTPGVFQ